MVQARIAVALAPLLLTLLLGWLTVEGKLTLGAGEKDVFLMLPLLAWALVFFLGCCVYWWRGAAPMRAALRAAVVATVFLLAPVVLYLLYWIVTTGWYVFTR